MEAPALAIQDDDHVRNRIGPWKPDGLADLAEFDPDTSFVVRAAAGSGKTTSLVARMVALVRQGVDVDSMAAITFTRKAAGEMSERFFKELRRAQQALEDGPDDQRLHVETALRDLQHGFMGTVHSFCARILREHALRVSLPPDFATGIEEREERKLRDKALNDYLQDVHEDDPERLAQIEQLGVDLNNIPEFFSRLCTFPDLEVYTDGPDEPPEMRAAAEKAAGKLREWQAACPDELPKEKPGKGMKAFDKAEAFIKHVGVDTPHDQAAFLKMVDGFVDSDGKGNVQVSYWGASKSSEREVACSIRDVEQPDLISQIRPLVRQWDAYVHRKLVELVEPAVSYFREMRRDRGDLTHGDLLFFTRELLRDNPIVRKRLQHRYHYLLVDEFQDTDPLQAEILFYLTGSNTQETDWRKCTPRPGSLFIVGDDKQSIYRFRRADKAIFDEVSHLVQQSGGELVDLTRNFRSLSPICDWCNAAFADLFGEAELKDIQAEYIPFQAHRGKGNNDVAVRRIDTAKVFRNNADDIAKADAKKIARFIRGAVDGKLAEWESGDEPVFEGAASFGDFLILTRAKSRLSIYAEALAQLNIPYTVTGSQDLASSPELRTLLEILRAALRPDDPIAAASYLKGGVCGFSDDDLYRFKQAGGSFRAMHILPDDGILDELDQELGDRVRAALHRITDARELLTSRRPARAIDQIAKQAGLLPAAAHPDDPSTASQRAGQFLRTMALIHHLADEGMDWAEIVEELQRIVDGDEEIDGMTLETGRDDAVRVLNVHKAKGLQAPVVFLADPYSSGSSHKPQMHVLRSEGKVVIPVVEYEGHYTSLLYAPLAWHAESTPAFESEEIRHDDAENRRLLYVAATRAQNMLVVSTYPEKANRGFWHELYPYLDRFDVPELSMPSIDRKEAFSAPAPSFQRDERTERLRRIKRPSYIGTTFTSVQDKDDQLNRIIQREVEGYGRKFGTALHELFEMMVRFRASVQTIDDVPVKAFFQDVVPDADSTYPQAHRMARNLLKSDLWDAIGRADHVMTEYPIAHCLGGDPPIIKRGVIDLLLGYEGGWKIVDYKSDQLDGVSTESYVNGSPYIQQVNSYADAWKELSGHDVIDQGLFFADSGTWIRI